MVLGYFAAKGKPVNLGNKLELLYCDILLHKYSKELQKAHDIHSSFLQIRIVSGSVLACSTQASCARFFGFAGRTDTTVVGWTRRLLMWWCWQ